MPATHSTSMAPTIDISSPDGSNGVSGLPISNLDTTPPTTEPATPRTIVPKHPAGCLPGQKKRAMAHTTSTNNAQLISDPQSMVCLVTP